MKRFSSIPTEPLNKNSAQESVAAKTELNPKKTANVKPAINLSYIEKLHQGVLEEQGSFALINAKVLALDLAKYLVDTAV